MGYVSQQSNSITWTTRNIPTTAGTIEVYDTGPADAPVVLFIHGAAVRASVWHGVVAALPGKVRCILPEMPIGSHRLPMHSDSDLSPRGLAGLLVEVLDDLGIKKVTVVCNDSGGAIGQVFTAYYPKRVARLVLTNCDALEAFPPSPYRYLNEIARRPLLLASIAKTLYAFPELGLRDRAYGGLARNVTCEQVRDWMQSAATDPAIRRDFSSFFAGADPSVTVDAALAIRASNVPLSIVWGDADPFFTVSLAKRLLAHIGRGDLRLVPDARTYVMLDAPEAVAQVIAAGLPAVAAAREHNGPAAAVMQ